MVRKINHTKYVKFAKIKFLPHPATIHFQLYMKYRKSSDHCLGYFSPPLHPLTKTLRHLKMHQTNRIHSCNSPGISKRIICTRAFAYFLRKYTDPYIPKAFFRAHKANFPSLTLIVIIEFIIFAHRVQCL